MEASTAERRQFRLWRQRRPRSLRRATVRLKDGYDRTTRRQRLARGIERVGRVLLFDDRGALILVLLFAFGPPLLPFDFALGLAPGEAQNFIQVLWQVEAGVVALIITIVLF